MVGPDYVRPVVEQPLYFKSQPASAEAPLISKQWWQLYGDSDLDQLIASAHASNQTLRQAVARLDEARALASVAAGFLYPTISLDPRFLRQRYSGNRRSTRTGLRQARPVTINDWLVPLDLTYEIEVWGRIRPSVESARATATPSAAHPGTVQLTVVTDVPPGLPAQLLARRPDVAEAEQNLVAANAQIGVATAAFYPTFNLTGVAGFESASASSIFDWRSAVAAIAPSISFPIFQGWRLTANLEATEARYRQIVAAYVNQILVAYADVEDALTDLHALSDEVGNLREAVSASQNYFRLAQAQYKFGLVDYLIVIDAERTLLVNQLSLAQAVNLQMGASIHLIKALGGGWTP